MDISKKSADGPLGHPVRPEGETSPNAFGGRGGISDRARIMIVDDDPGLGQLLTAFLGQRNYEANYFTNPTKALTCLNIFPSGACCNGVHPAHNVMCGVNLLITDLQMPEMTGLELTRQAKALYPGLPVIVMSGSASGQDRDEIFSLGADFIPKPFELADLLIRINSRLNRPACR